ncbi:MAG: hypothetical protein HQK66_00935, partial [Desulfamplus sp.]|nr:hypothetical protein [Desulfamplus sp.]
GTEEYLYTWSSGKGQREGVTDTASYSDVPLTYTAPTMPGIHTVTVFDSAGNSAKAEVIVSGGAKRSRIEKTSIFEIANPRAHPSSETQPVGVGPVQHGEPAFAMAFDFANYEDGEGTPVPMNYYVAVFIPEWDFWGMFDAHGGVFDLNDGVIPCLTRGFDSVYFEGLTFDYCNPVLPIHADMYILAVESGYDPQGNLELTPAAAPFELWQFKFSFPACP